MSSTLSVLLHFTLYLLSWLVRGSKWKKNGSYHRAPSSPPKADYSPARRHRWMLSMSQLTWIETTTARTSFGPNTCCSKLKLLHHCHPPRCRVTPRFPRAATRRAAVNHAAISRAAVKGDTIRSDAESATPPRRTVTGAARRQGGGPRCLTRSTHRLLSRCVPRPRFLISPRGCHLLAPERCRSRTASISTQARSKLLGRPAASCSWHAALSRAAGLLCY